MNKHLLLKIFPPIVFMLLGMAPLANAENLTLSVDSWTKNCSGIFLPAHGNNLCVGDSQANSSCKGSVRPSSATTRTSTSLMNGMPSGWVGSSDYYYGIAFSCSGAGNTKTCQLDSSASGAKFIHYSSGCNNVGLQNAGAITGAYPVEVTLPADTNAIVYGNDTHAICYTRTSAATVECRRIYVNTSVTSPPPLYISSVAVTSWGFETPVTIFTASELDDTDSDGVINAFDFDDDNDGVPDNIDMAPLDNANSSEITLPLNSGYKGMRLENNTIH
jgi:hypothetical protein